jgi:hypothetical protein
MVAALVPVVFFVAEEGRYEIVSGDGC